MKNDKLTRRDFFTRATAVGAVTVGTGSLLAACGGGESQSESTPPPPPPAAETASVDCSDLSGLSDTDLATRTSLQYVEKSEISDQDCANCQLFTAAEDDASCSGCQIIKGPIAAEGYCISWAAVITS